jgi:hypothetical protein
MNRRYREERVGFTADFGSRTPVLRRDAWDVEANIASMTAKRRDTRHG